jgi:hypothetical protein
MSIFSAKYRPLAKEGLKCVFRTLTMRPCETGLDERLKAELVSSTLRFSPGAARAVNKHFTALSWIFVILTFASLAYVILGIYNFYYYGNCDGPGSTGGCIINDITGDYGRFSEPTDLIPPTALDGITAGNPKANVTVIEFGCFTCPYTAEADTIVQQLLREHNNTIYYVFKPFPLPNHNYSFDAARAVLCANRQGKQWELREAIFRQQTVCSTEGTLAIKQIATDAGLNMTAFDSCYDDNETGPEVAKYIQEGKDAHLYATPTFFINGKPIVGPRPIQDFETAIREAGG